MKKIVALLLSLMMAGTLVSCANKPVSSGGSSEYKKIVYMCAALGDMSFNDSGNVGINTLKNEHGFETQLIETGEDVSKYEAYVREVCEDPEVGYLVVSSSYHEYVDMVAADYPEMRFIVFDIGRDTKVASDNVVYIAYAQYEGSYLVGMVAAAMSESGVIGAVGGVQNPVISDFITGYIDGAIAYNPDIKVTTAWVGSWTDAPAMLELCTTQYNTYGTDVFFPIAGGAGTGAFEAALNIGNIWTIGVDLDQYEVFKSANNKMADVIVTSMLKEVGNSFVSMFTDLKEGKEYWGTVRTMGIKENAVGYVNNDFFQKTVPADVIAKVEAAKEKIANGEIKVKSYFDFANGASDYNAYVESVKP